MKIFSYEDERLIKDVFTPFFHISGMTTRFLHSACAELARREPFSQINISDNMYEVSYLFYAAVDKVLSKKLFEKVDIESYLSDRAMYLCDIGLFVKKPEIRILESLVLILLTAYDKCLRLKWLTNTSVMESKEEEIDICIKNIEDIELLSLSHDAYGHHFKKRGYGIAHEIEQILEQNHRKRLAEIKLNSIALEDIMQALDHVEIERLKTIQDFLKPIIERSYGHSKPRYIQGHEIGKKITDRKIAHDVEQHKEVYYSFLKCHQGVWSDKEVVARLKERAEQGATALARYLASSEGKMHFDFTGLSYAEIIRTINKEIGTNISEQAFQRAITRNRLIIS